MAPEDACTSDMLVLIRWQGRNMAVPSRFTPAFWLFWAPSAAALCARKLIADSAKLGQNDHELTNEDLLAFATARAAAETRKAESRKSPRRRHRPRPTREARRLPFFHNAT